MVAWVSVLALVVVVVDFDRCCGFLSCGFGVVADFGGVADLVVRNLVY